jgi:hypothetical protein
MPGNTFGDPSVSIGWQLIRIIKTSNMYVYVLRKVLILIEERSATGFAKASFYCWGSFKVCRVSID